MRVELILDTTDHRDTAMRDEINGWLNYLTLRGAWTLTETEADQDEDDEGEGRWTTLTFDFVEALDAADFRYWRCLNGRGRLL
jgi:hypothetical protein